MLWVNANGMLELYGNHPGDAQERIQTELEYLRRTGAMVRVLQANKPALKESSVYGEWLVYHTIRTDDHVLGFLIGVLPEQGMIDAVMLKLFDVMLRNTAFALDHFADEQLATADRLYRIANEAAASSVARFKFISDRDRLTGLATRADFLHHTGLLQSRDTGTDAVMVMSLDFDNFKAVNAGHGYAAGDAVLETAAQRLVSLFKDADFLAAYGLEGIPHCGRTGEDEFSLVFSAQSAPDDSVLAALGGALAERLSDPYIVDGDRVRVRASAGVSADRNAGITAADLLLQAQHARAAARDQGAAVQVFEAAMAPAGEGLSEASLAAALREGQLRVFYQPTLDVTSGAVSGAEALLRWQHPAEGLIGPERFLALAESSGLIHEIGEYVLREACRLLAQADEAGYDDFSVSVNLSPVQLLDADLPAKCRAIADTHSADPARIGLEVSGAGFERHGATAEQVLRELGENGFCLMIDDFGGSNSSLSVLRDLPVKLIKIDSAFVQNLPDSKVDNAIAQAMVAMAQDLNMEILAEGIESEDQLENVRALGCDRMQGYFLGRPCGYGEFEAMMNEWRSVADVVI
ncbi:phosphodiesterase [Granulosicoccaceae sp. 1_MG-2023]|nr:phosphodiesterase [Granulosicoccaceae sp. 1_MG-2023]